MRHPFYIDRLSPAEQKTVKRWYLCGFGLYAALSLFVAIGLVAMKNEHVQSQIAKLSLTSDAAAETPRR
jgi:hypothetical protein